MKNSKIHSGAQLVLASALIVLTACEGSSGGSAGATVTTGPIVAFVGSAQLAAEGGGTVLVGVELSVASTEPVTVPFGVAGSATALADFTIDPSPLVVPAGQTTAEIAIVVLDDALNEALEEIVLTLGAPTNAGLGMLTTHTASIEDDDLPPVVEFEAPDAAIGEADAAAIATLRLSAPSGLDVSVPFTVGGTADSDDVVSITDGPIVVPAGAISAAITITPADDLIDELDETVVLTLGSPTNAELGTAITHTTLIADDDAPPTVAFELADQDVDETAMEASISIALSAPSGLEIVVPYIVGGSATEAADFELDPGPLVIPAGEVSASLSLVVVDDVLDELDETVTLTLLAPTHADLGAIFAHTAFILDDDAAPSVAFTTPDQGIEEASGAAAATVELSVVSGLDVTVPFVVGGTATEGSDFTLAASPLVIPAGELAAEIAIAPVNDALQEPGETIEIVLETPTNASLGTSIVHTATILDDDASPVVEFVSPGSAATEGSGTVIATLQLSVPSGFDVSVPFELLGTAGVPDDYTTTPSPVLIPAGTTVANIIVILADDALDEPDETAVIMIGAPVHALAGPSDTYTLILLDDDDPPTVAFTSASQVADEGAGVVPVDVVLSSASAFEVGIPFTIGGTATHLDDFLVYPDPPLIVVPAGQVTAAIVVTVVDDSLSEPDETVELVLGTPTNAALGGATQHVVTIVDDEDLRVGFAAPAQTVGEDVGQALVTVELSSVATFDVTVPYSVSGTATPTADFSIAPGPLEIPAGQISIDLSISVVDESLFEGAETVVVTLGAPVNAGLGAEIAHELTIQDDDSPPTVTFAFAAQDAGEEQGTANVMLELSTVSGLDVVVPLAFGGTATPQADYVIPGGPIVVPAGQQSAEVPIAILSDDLDEPAETIVIDIAQGVTGADHGALLQHTITLTDDDTPPTVAFTTGGQNVLETGGSVAFTVQLSAPSGWDVTVPFTIAGTAEDQADFASGGNAIAIPAGGLSGTGTLAILDDLLDEPNETVVLSLGTPSNASLGDPALHTVTILDDDAAPTLAFATTSAAIGEADGTASFTVQLSAVSGQDVVVPYSVAGTADQPDDYSIAASPLLVPAGQSFADIDVSLVDDVVGEGDETVVVTLGTPTNADLGVPAQSELVILDDDPPVVEFVAATQSTPEGAAAIAVVRLSKIALLDVTVPFTVGGTADDPDDYTLSSSPLVIPAGQQTGTLDFALVGDVLYEEDETILVTLTTPVNGMLGGQSIHTLTILDDDAPPTVQFATAAQTTLEPNPYLIVVTIELSQPSGTDLLVPFTIGGTATSPDDYSIQQSPIAIAAGDISACIAVAMVDDALGEIDETLELTLVAPPGLTLGAIGVHTITIIDNDGGPGPSLDLVLEPAAWTMFVGETVTLTALGQQVDDVVWHIAEPLAGDFRDTGNATTRSNPAQFVGGRYPGKWRVTASNKTTGAEATMLVTLLPLELTFHDVGVAGFTKATQRGPAWARSVLPTSRAFDALPLVAIDPRGLATGPIIHVVLAGPDGAILSLDRDGVPVGASPIAPDVDLSAMRAIAVDPEGGVVLVGERALVRVRGGETEVWILEIPVVGIRDLSVGPRGAIWIVASDEADSAAGSIRVLNAVGREILVIREIQVDGSLRVLRGPMTLAVGPDGSIHIFEEIPWDGVGDRPGVRRTVAEPTIATRHR